MADNESFDSNAGINRLANVMTERMKRENESPLYIDFGEIQANMSLTTNTFPVPIPKGQYSVCRHVGGLSFETYKGEHNGHLGSNTGKHKHIIEPPTIKPGDRVLVAWVQSEAVVIDIVVNS